jgi:shikimate kinase
MHHRFISCRDEARPHHRNVRDRQVHRPRRTRGTRLQDGRVADEWLWREERIARLLSTEDAAVLFVSGTVRNQVKFYALFDHVVLLSAPAEVMSERLRSRTNNPYGKDPDELAEVLDFKNSVEPSLRRAADLEIDTSAPIDQVVARVLTLVV